MTQDTFDQSLTFNSNAIAHNHPPIMGRKQHKKYAPRQKQEESSYRLIKPYDNEK